MYADYTKRFLDSFFAAPCMKAFWSVVADYEREILNGAMCKGEVANLLGSNSQGNYHEHSDMHQESDAALSLQFENSMYHAAGLKAEKEFDAQLQVLDPAMLVGHF